MIRIPAPRDGREPIALPLPDKRVGTNCACGVPGCSGSAA